MDNRSMNPLERERALLLGHVPCMRWDGNENFTAWQTRAGGKLKALLGVSPEPCAPLFRTEWEKDCGTYTETYFTFQSEPGYFVPCHLLLPKGVRKPPVMICLQGHSTGQHISLGTPVYPGDAETIAGGRDFAVQAVQHGLAALTMDQRGFGQCGGTAEGPQCHVPAMTALLLGRTMIGERVWDISRSIDVLEAEFSDVVDTDKIGCMGNSGGGTATFYAACVEKRIRVAVPSCAVCTYEASIAAMPHCVCNFIPGIAPLFDMGDLAGLIAPRPLIIVCGKDDPIFPLPGVKESYALAERAYNALNASDRLHLVIGGQGHQFYPQESWPIMMETVEQL